MAGVESRPAGSSETILDLRNMRELKNQFSALNLGELKKAEKEERDEIVVRTIGQAEVVYEGLEYREKIDQARKIKEAYLGGKLTLDGLLRGLGLPEAETGNGGILGKIKGLFSKPKNSQTHQANKN